jgi:hemerythrin-like domain-containing protein
VQSTWFGAGIEKNSDLIKSIKIDYSNSDEIIIYANSYAENIQKGRKKFAKKIPINFLIEFVKKNGKSVKNVNSVAYAIQNSIYKNGISGKNIINGLEKPLVKTVEPKIDEYLIKIIEQNVKYK